MCVCVNNSITTFIQSSTAKVLNNLYVASHRVCVSLEFLIVSGYTCTEFLAPIETTGMTTDDVDQLMTKTQDVMQAKFDQFWKELESRRLVAKESE